MSKVRKKSPKFPKFLFVNAEQRFRLLASNFCLIYKVNLIKIGEFEKILYLKIPWTDSCQMSTEEYF